MRGAADSIRPSTDYYECWAKDAAQIVGARSALAAFSRDPERGLLVRLKTILSSMGLR
jgi:hypothetical protein